MKQPYIPPVQLLHGGRGSEQKNSGALIRLVGFAASHLIAVAVAWQGEEGAEQTAKEKGH